MDKLAFADPVTHVYNPLAYARSLHEQYLTRFADGPKRVLFLGMNPGPWGMAQTGVPFGEVAAVRGWMKIDGEVGSVNNEHPKRPVLGLTCPRSEVSGRRLWGLMADRFGPPEVFFGDAGGQFVTNYCPLVFMESTGRNRTPDKLPAAEREPLEAVCDAHLRTLVETLAPEFVVGVGKFAEAKARRVLGDTPNGITITTVLHPSPASPAANRGWAERATTQLVEAGVWP